MSRKCNAIFVLLVNLPVAIAIAITAQLLAVGKIIFPLLAINFPIAYGIAFLIGMFLPAPKWGVAFAMKCKAQPDTLKFGLLVNVVVNMVYVVILVTLLTFFNVVILNHGPIIGFVMGVLTSFIPIYLVGFVVSFLFRMPAENLAKKICKE